MEQARSRENLFDYFLLTVVVGIGLLISILAFTFSTRLLNQSSQNQFETLVANIHPTVEAKIGYHLMEYKILNSFAVNLDIAKHHASNDVSRVISSSAFSCVVLISPKSGRSSERYTLKFLKTSPDCNQERIFENLTLAEGALHLDEHAFQYGGNPLSSIHLVSRLKGPKRYLVAVLPLNRLLASLDEAQSMISMDFRFSTPIKATNERLLIKKDVPFLDRTGTIIYRPSDGEFGLNMGWAWTIFIAGLLVSFLFAAILFNLIEKSFSIRLEVEKKTADLQKATQQALLANKTKSRFLANVSHEVRTPLNLILGMAELLLETPLNYEQKSYVTTFRRASGHLLGIIEDILDVARIEAGETNYEKTEINLVELIEGVSDFVVSACRTKKITYDYQIAPGVPSIVIADPKRLRQILINLINNALKFTDRGGISVSVDILPNPSDDRALVSFQIKDTGIGIPDVELEKIFEEFYQVDSDAKRSSGGVGLGLSIVRTYVRYLGGSIDVQSQLGEGSTFSIQMPFVTKNKTCWLEDYKSYREHLTEKKILLVSPNPVQSQFIRKSLEQFGCSLTVMESGHSALKTLKRNDDFDYYILDIVAHDINAIDIVRTLNLEKEQCNKIVLLCPLVHRARDQADFTDLNITKVCYTPIKIRSLLGILTNAERDCDPQPHILPQTIPPGLRILIAEDDRENRFLVQAYLANLGIELEFAENGEVALEYFKAKRAYFDLLITDIQMPRMDGLKLIQEIRKFESSNELQPIPIVTLTADAQPEQVEKMKNLGGNEYITKPISKKDLIDTIARYEIRHPLLVKA